MCDNNPHIKIGSVGSDFNTIETPMQFCADRFGLDDQKNSFLKVHYRIKNIHLSKVLLETQYSETERIKKVTKGLSCCSSMAGIEVGNRGAAVYKTSAKCRQPVCAACNQTRSAKFRRRFVKCFNSDEARKLFEGKYFYLITLTLSHNATNKRNYVYLDEIKAYMTELRRCKLWKTHFPYSKKNPVSGFAQSYELTMGKNGYHIHSHILMCAPALKGKVLKIEQQFRDKWKHLTKDSTGFQLDLIKIDAEEIEKIKEGKPSKKLSGFISETLKYTVKVGDLHNISKYKADLLANWLIVTKGKNMITSNGFFRPLQLFTNKSKWDEDLTAAPMEYSQKNKYLVGRTCDIGFNHQKNKHYKKIDRHNVLHTVYLKTAPNFIDITDCAAEFEKFFNMAIEPNQLKNKGSSYDNIQSLIDSARLEKQENIYLAQFCEKNSKKRKEQFFKDIGFDPDNEQLFDFEPNYTQDSEELTQELIDELSKHIKDDFIQPIGTIGQQTVLDLYPFDDW